jgi:hypothetical protein
MPAAKKKTIQWDESSILEKYMELFLEGDDAIKNVYTFCKKNDIAEGDFYTFYANLDQVKNAFWSSLIQRTLQTLEKSEDFSTYAAREKLLSFYFTFFENLTLNRSYVLAVLPSDWKHWKNWKQLHAVREGFLGFIEDVMSTQTTVIDEKFSKALQPLYKEGFWGQFLYILKYWIEDTSKGFENTDILIEKSVQASFDLVQNTPLNSLLDLGKFLLKDKFPFSKN